MSAPVTAGRTPDDPRRPRLRPQAPPPLALDRRRRRLVARRRRGDRHPAARPPPSRQRGRGRDPLRRTAEGNAAEAGARAVRRREGRAEVRHHGRVQGALRQQHHQPRGQRGRGRRHRLPAQALAGPGARGQPRLRERRRPRCSAGASDSGATSTATSRRSPTARTISLYSDPANEAQGLWLLERAGLITLEPGDRQVDGDPGRHRRESEEPAVHAARLRRPVPLAAGPRRGRRLHRVLPRRRTSRHRQADLRAGRARRVRRAAHHRLRLPRRRQHQEPRRGVPGPGRAGVPRTDPRVKGILLPLDAE